MNIGLIIIGDEILSGKRRDAHLPKVIELLGARGMTLGWARFEGDDRARITAVLGQAVAGGDLVFCCGGIGATPDDHTRQAAAAALGRPLVLHPQARELIVQRMRDTAAKQGQDFDPERPDNLQRLNMGMFPEGAAIIENPYNRIPGFSVGHLHCMPGFPVMAWPMIEALLDGPYAHLHGAGRMNERSVIVFAAIEAMLTPLMEAIEATHEGVKVFSLPSVDHPEWGHHVELGVKGRGEAVDRAYAVLLRALRELGVSLGPELVR